MDRRFRNLFRWQRLTPFSILLLYPFILQAQPGIAEFTQATRQVHEWYFGVTELVFAIAAITGIVGGTRVYTNWQIGGHRHRHPIDTQVIGWFLSCIFLVIAGIYVKALYGV